MPWGHSLRVSTCISDLGSDCSVLTAASTISSARAGQPPSSKHQPTHSTSHTLRQRLPHSGNHFKQILQLHVLFFFFFLFLSPLHSKFWVLSQPPLPCQALQISAVSRSQDAHAPPPSPAEPGCHQPAPPRPPGDQGPGASRAVSSALCTSEVSACKIHKENLLTSPPCP